MSRITHFKSQPVNIQYWDYYILCRLNSEATIALQRMEYWDGTKDAGNSHAEDINDMQALSGETPTQDVSAWIYKSQDELHWELMGVVGEKKVKDLFRVLEEDLGYIKVRNNPYKGWDRKKQYEFEAGLVQSHINYLGYIVSFFGLPLRRLRPIFYAIEALTRSGIYIDQLNVKLVIKKISEFREDPKLPHFLKNDLEKLGNLSTNQPLRSFGNFAEWKAQNCGMQSAESPNASRKTADSIPQKRGSNSIEYKTEKTKQRRQREDKENAASQQRATVSTEQESSLSPSLSQNLSSSLSSSEEKPTKEAKLIPVDYALFDRLCRAKGYAADFKVPRNEKNNAAIKELREQGANAEQVEFVFNDIWEDKDTFWQQHRGKPSTVASQFTARVWKMTAPAEKRRTASGLTNWTEDKTMGVPAVIEPVVSTPAPEPAPTPTLAPTPTSAPAKPKEPALPVGYTRLKLDKPARPRTAYGRRLQAERDAQ